MVPPSARSAQGGTRQQTTARRHRGLLPAVSEPVVLVAGASTHSCTHQQALHAAVSATHPVQSTGKGHRVGGRSESDRRPESLAGASCPRRGQPLPSAGPWATIHHRARSRDLYFRKDLTRLLLFELAASRMHARMGVPHTHLPIRDIFHETGQVTSTLFLK